MNNCKQIPKKYTLLNNISLHILILFIILSAVFVFYISKVEADNINNEIIEYINKIDFNSLINGSIKGDSAKAAEQKFIDDFLINSCGQDPSGFTYDICAAIGIGYEEIKKEIDTINDPADKTVKKMLSKVVKPDYFINKLTGTKNQRAEEINLKVKEEICMVIGFLILIIILINILPVKFFKYCNNTILGLIGELLIVFVLIGIIEVLFFENVATKYNPIPPSLIVQAFKDKCLNIINS